MPASISTHTLYNYCTVVGVLASTRGCQLVQFGVTCKLVYIKSHLHLRDHLMLSKERRSFLTTLLLSTLELITSSHIQQTCGLSWLAILSRNGSGYGHLVILCSHCSPIQSYFGLIFSVRVYTVALA